MDSTKTCIASMKSELVLYCAGKRLDDKDDAVIQEAITRHFDILQQVSELWK